MRVLHVIMSTSPRHGGPSTALGAFILAGRAAGVEAEVLTTNIDGDEASPWEAEIPVHRARCWPRRGYPLSWPLVRWLAREGPRFDVFQIHGLWRFNSIATYRAARRQGRALVLRPCGHLSPESREYRSGRKALYYRAIDSKVVAGADGLHFTTVEERDAAGTEVDSSRSFIVPPPVTPPAVIGRDEARDALAVPRDAGLVISVARLDPIKGHDLSIEAIAGMRRKPLLCLIGPDKGGTEKLLRRQAAEAGVADRVRFEGLADRAQVGRWISAADVLLSASAHENFGLSLAEAAMCGLPIVATRTLSIMGQLGDRVVGVEREPQAIARGLETVLEAGQPRSDRLRDHARSLWSEAVVGRQLAEMYRAVRGK